MDTCANCHLPVKEGQRRCFSCGALIPGIEEQSAPGAGHSFGGNCGKCGALLPQGDGPCLICGTPRDSVPYEGVFPVPAPEGPAPLPYPRDRSQRARAPTDAWRRWGGTLSALLCAVILVFLGVGVYRQYFDTSSYRARESIVFMAEDGGLYLQHPGLAQSLPIEGVPAEAAVSGSALCASGNGRYLAYTTNAGTAYLLDLGQTTAEDTKITAVAVAEGLAGAAMFADNTGTLVYLDSNREMHSASPAGNWLLDTDVDELLGAEGGIVLYTRRESRDSGTRDDLYLTYLTEEGGDWQLIDRNILEVLDWTDGFSRLLYTVLRTNADGSEEVSLGSFDLRQNSTSTMATDIGRVVDASAETGAVLYLQEKQQLWSFRQFVDDDLAEEDALITEPDLADYPVLAEAAAQYGLFANYSDLSENEALIEQNIAYLQALERWENKLLRDELRQALHHIFAAQSDYLVLFDLYVCQSSGVRRLDADLLIPGAFSRDSGAVDALHGHAVYEVIDTASLQKIRLSELWEQGRTTLDLYDWYMENTRRELRYTSLSGIPARLYERAAGSSFFHRQWIAPPGSDSVYFTIGGEEGGTELYHAPYRSGAVSQATRVDRSVANLLAPLRGGALYESEDGGLVLAQEQTLRRFGAENAAVAGIENGGETLLYFGSFSQATQIGDLHLANRDDFPLASNAVEYVYRSDQLVYVWVSGDDEGSRDLYEWRGGNLTLLSRGARGSLAAPL